MTLRLKNDGDAQAYVITQVNRFDGDASRTLAQRNAPGSGGWETHQFVVTVPRDGDALFVYAGLTGKGRIQVDGLAVEPVSDATPLSPAQPVDSGGPLSCAGAGGGCGGAVDYYTGSSMGSNGGYNVPSSHYHESSPPAPNH